MQSSMPLLLGVSLAEAVGSAGRRQGGAWRGQAGPVPGVSVVRWRLGGEEGKAEKGERMTNG